MSTQTYPEEGTVWRDPFNKREVLLDFSHMRSREAFREFYDEDGRKPEMQCVHYRPTYMRHLLGRLKRSDILELGSSTGGNLYYLALLGNTVTGVECSRPLVANFHHFQAQMPLPMSSRIQLIEGMIEDLDLPHRFEWILATEILEHVFDPVEVLKVGRRHSLPNGKIFITAPEPRWGGSSHVRGVTVADLEEWLPQAGWRLTEAFVEMAGLGFAEPYRQTVAFAEAVPCES